MATANKADELSTFKVGLFNNRFINQFVNKKKWR